jgi:hypothetical protein
VDDAGQSNRTGNPYIRDKGRARRRYVRRRRCPVCSGTQARPTRFLICSTPKLVPFLASPERNFEHRRRQPEAGRS